MYIFTHYVLRLCLRTWNRRVTVDVASILVLMLITADTSNTLIRDEEEKLVEVLFYVHRNRSLIGDGEPRTATSTFTQLLSSEGGKMGGGGGSIFFLLFCI